MRKKFIIKTILISIVVILLFTTKAYCIEDNDSVRTKVDNSGRWTNITIGEAYEECEELNSTSSTLGTGALEAHLVTDYDWSAMAIFSVSQYGETTTNSPGNTSTTKNKTGIYDIGGKTQTTTLLNRFRGTAAPYDKLYDSNGNLKKYINLIDPETGKEYNSDETETGRIAISYVSGSEGGTSKWFGGIYSIGTSTSYPVGIREGMFGSIFGFMGCQLTIGASGAAFDGVSFRPVIWN